MDFHYQIDADIKAVHIERDGATMRVTIGDRGYDVTVLHSRADELSFTVDGVTHTAFVAGEGASRLVAIEGDVYELKRPVARRDHRTHQHSAASLTASLPGQITKVLIDEGAVVQRGQSLIALEAMKMEIKIAAPHDGRVARVLVKPGQVVDRGQALIEMDQDH
jgi:biotin carboxyl carrier protein